MRFGKRGFSIKAEAGVHFGRNATGNIFQNLLAKAGGQDAALTEWQEENPRGARIVELRYFGGLSVEETAGTLRISEETVTRDWRLARGWLPAQISARS